MERMIKNSQCYEHEHQWRLFSETEICLYMYIFDNAESIQLMLLPFLIAEGYLLLTSMYVDVPDSFDLSHLFT